MHWYDMCNKYKVSDMSAEICQKLEFRAGRQRFEVRALSRSESS